MLKLFVLFFQKLLLLHQKNDLAGFSLLILWSWSSINIGSESFVFHVFIIQEKLHKYERSQAFIKEKISWKIQKSSAILPIDKEYLPASYTRFWDVILQNHSL